MREFFKLAALIAMVLLSGCSVLPGTPPNRAAVASFSQTKGEGSILLNPGQDSSLINCRRLSEAQEDLSIWDCKEKAGLSKIGAGMISIIGDLLGAVLKTLL